MGLFDCGKSRKRARPVISRPLETAKLANNYHAHPTRTGEGLRIWREAEARRKADMRHGKSPKKYEGQKWAGRGYATDEDERYPNMREIEESERYGPRAKYERYQYTATPLLDDGWQGAFDQLSSKGSKQGQVRTLRVINDTADIWSSDGGLARPERGRLSPRAQKPQLRVQIPVYTPRNGTFSPNKTKYPQRPANTAPASSRGKHGYAVS